MSVKNVTYTGKAQKPKPTVKLGGTTLELKKDYTVSYADNVDAGTATVTVKGTGRFTDSVEKTFKIKKAAQAIKAKNAKKTVKLKKGEKKLEPYSITVSLQVDEDKLTSVTLNGEVITITNNQATINITEVGEYKLCMEAVDEAGNVSSDEYEFKLISEAEQNFWIISAILAAVAVLVIIILLVKRRKKDN